MSGRQAPDGQVKPDRRDQHEPGEQRPENRAERVDRVDAPELFGDGVVASDAASATANGNAAPKASVIGKQQCANQQRLAHQHVRELILRPCDDLGDREQRPVDARRGRQRANSARKQHDARARRLGAARAASRAPIAAPPAMPMMKIATTSAEGVRRGAEDHARAVASTPPATSAMRIRTLPTPRLPATG